MGSHEQSVDQRKQQVGRGRSKEEWEVIALKCLLLQPEITMEIRDTIWTARDTWMNPTSHIFDYMIGLQREVGAYGVTAGTFVKAISKALKAIDRRAKYPNCPNNGYPGRKSGKENK